jgi:hypothetical protein
MALTNFALTATPRIVGRSPIYGIVLRSSQTMVRWQGQAATTIEAKHVATVLRYLDQLLGVQFAEVWLVQQALTDWSTEIYFRACFNEDAYLEFVAKEWRGRVTIHRVNRIQDEIHVEPAELPLHAEE